MRKKIREVFTLSCYEIIGEHKTDGRPTKKPALSLIGIYKMLQGFKGLPAGTKIEVTMEVCEGKKRG